MSNKTYKIAVVDDENEILETISTYLEKYGNYDVITFANPLKALDTIDISYDLVLLDIMMPQMNGLEVLERLIAINPNQKVVMMTAYSTLDKVLKAHKEGATHYFMKPFESMKALENKISEVLNP
ncbi:MAG: response regulator [Campylobacterota bacterium]|nr:response regulator [Campylobacterota bacterium]